MINVSWLLIALDISVIRQYNKETFHPTATSSFCVFLVRRSVHIYNLSPTQQRRLSTPNRPSELRFPFLSFPAPFSLSQSTVYAKRRWCVTRVGVFKMGLFVGKDQVKFQRHPGLLPEGRLMKVGSRVHSAEWSWEDDSRTSHFYRILLKQHFDPVFTRSPH